MIVSPPAQSGWLSLTTRLLAPDPGSLGSKQRKIEQLDGRGLVQWPGCALLGWRCGSRGICLVPHQATLAV